MLKIIVLVLELMGVVLLLHIHVKMSTIGGILTLKCIIKLMRS